MRRFRFDKRSALWSVACAGVALAALVTGVLGWSGWRWEAAQASGLMAAIVCMLLCAWPVRPRETQPPTLLTLRAHEWLGWAALGAVALHVIGSVLAEPQSVEYLKWSAPRYQLAGMVAAGMLAVMVCGSGARVRRRFTNHRAFQAVHVIGGCVVLVAATLHVVVTARQAGGSLKRWAFLAVTVGALAMLLRRRRPRSGANAGVAAGGPRLAFGRHSRLVAACVGVLMVACASLAAHRMRLGLREPTLPLTTHVLPLDFPHTQHMQVNCLTCHHNFADGRGFENCVLCHQSDRSDLTVGAEARFHDFCLECHRHPEAALKGHGPASGCAGCHRRSAAGGGAAWQSNDFSMNASDSNIDRVLAGRSYTDYRNSWST